LIAASNVHIFLRDLETGEPSYGTARFANGLKGPAMTIRPRKHGITSAVLHSGQPVIVNDVASHPLFREDPVHTGNLKSIAGFPFRRAEETLGAMTVAFLSPHTFTTDEVRVLQLLADQAGTAVHNAHLYRQARDKAQQLERLQEMTRLIAATLEPEEIYDVLTQQIGRLVQTDWVGLARFVPEEQVFTMESVAGSAETLVTTGLSLPAIETPFVPLTMGASTYESEPGDGSAGWLEQSLAAAGYQSLAALALSVREEPLGALLVARCDARGFDGEDMAALEELTGHAALALYNADLLSARQQALHDLQEAQEQLVQSERLRAVGRMADSVAHNFNNLLMVISGRTQLAARHATREEIEVDLAVIRRAAEDGADLVRRLRDVASEESALWDVSVPSTDLLNREPERAGKGGPDTLQGTRVMEPDGGGQQSSGDGGVPAVLVIDDDPDVRGTFGKILSLENYRPLLAADGRSGIELFRRERPAVVVTDLGMPGMSGWEVAHTIHTLSPGTPVALVTGWGETVDPEEARAAHVAAVVSKPVELDDVLEVVASLLGRGRGSVAQDPRV
jgi:GAF domain-containing protein/ActR/RegA family two-component response regulator